MRAGKREELAHAPALECRHNNMPADSLTRAGEEGPGVVLATKPARRLDELNSFRFLLFTGMADGRPSSCLHATGGPGNMSRAADFDGRASDEDTRLYGGTTCCGRPFFPFEGARGKPPKCW